MKAIDLADFIITYANSVKKPPTDTRLNNLMYLVNVMYLLDYGEPLVEDETPIKTGFGAKFPNVYEEYRVRTPYEIDAVHSRYQLHRDELGKWSIEMLNQFNPKELLTKDKLFIAKLINKLSNFYTSELVELVNKEYQHDNIPTKEYNYNLSIIYWGNEDNIFWEGIK